MNTQEKIAIAAVAGIFLLIGGCIGREIHRENSREYQLVCKTGAGVEVFRSSWGRRATSNDWKWYTPDGAYIQSPETLCKSFYRQKDEQNQ